MSIKAIEILTTYSNGNKKVLAEVECSRCSGHGRLESYRTVDNGICFKCEGLGVEKKVTKVGSDESIVMITETTTIKPLKKVNDDEAMRNAMLRINAERREKREEIERVKEADKKLKEEMESDNFEPFSW